MSIASALAIAFGAAFLAAPVQAHVLKIADPWEIGGIDPAQASDVFRWLKRW